MHVGEVMTADVANGEGMRVSVFVSGCRNHFRGSGNQRIIKIKETLETGKDVLSELNN